MEVKIEIEGGLASILGKDRVLGGATCILLNVSNILWMTITIPYHTIPYNTGEN